MKKSLTLALIDLVSTFRGWYFDIIYNKI